MKGCFVIEQETLAQFVRRNLREKGLSYAGVQRRAGGAISKGYICDIGNGLEVSLTVKKLQALARGLDVPEDEIFTIARGAAFNQRNLDTSRFALMYFRYHRLPEEDRQAVDLLLDAVDREIEWRRKRAIERETRSTTIIKMNQTVESPCLCR
ncbi:MAG: helix-turn-helix domain-containing protein [Blastocatellia bacterium]